MIPSCNILQIPLSVYAGNEINSLTGLKALEANSLFGSSKYKYLGFGNVLNFSDFDSNSNCKSLRIKAPAKLLHVNNF